MDVKPKIAFLISKDWYYVSHRESLALSLIKQGFDVTLITEVENFRERINKTGVKVIDIFFYRSIKNIFREILTIKEIFFVYKKTQADIIHQVSLKPCFYGAMALLGKTRKSKKPIVINAFTGLGYVFTSQKTIARSMRFILIPLLRALFKKKNMHVVFQNRDDEKIFLENLIVKKWQCHLIPGSGVDTKQYSLADEPDSEMVVMLVSRMLIEKGIIEFVEAAKIIKKHSNNIKFILVGDTDHENPSGISIGILRSWHEEGVIEWWGKQNNMPSTYKKAHIIVLPSYREGLPKVLLEAAACGKPIVTTDVPGCRDAIIDDETGILVPEKNSTLLAEAIKELINDKQKRQSMGLAGRKLIEEKFSTEIINNEFLKLYKKLLKEESLGLTYEI